MKSLFTTTLNNAIVNQLMEGTAESVQQLMTFGAEADAQLLWMDDEGKAHTETLWHWSHRAPLSDGVERWWLSLQWQLASLSPRGAADLLHVRLADALRAAGASGQSQPILTSWKQCLDAQGDYWSRRHMMGQLVNALEEQGDRAIPWLRAMGQSGAVRAQDWTPLACQAYPEDPLVKALDRQAFRLTALLMDQGANPKERLPSGKFFVNASRQLGLVSSAQQGEALEEVLERLLKVADSTEQQQFRDYLEQSRLRSQSVDRLQGLLRQRQLEDRSSEERPAASGRSRARHRS